MQFVKGRREPGRISDEGRDLAGACSCLAKTTGRLSPPPISPGRTLSKHPLPASRAGVRYASVVGLPKSALYPESGLASESRMSLLFPPSDDLSGIDDVQTRRRLRRRITRACITGRSVARELPIFLVLVMATTVVSLLVLPQAGFLPRAAVLFAVLVAVLWIANRLFLDAGREAERKRVAHRILTDEGRCPHCGYDLHFEYSKCCPECGAESTALESAERSRPASGGDRLASLSRRRGKRAPPPEPDCSGVM